MEARKYKTLDGAKRGFDKIVNEWPKHLNMADRLWIHIYSDHYRLTDYARRDPTEQELKTRMMVV